MTTDEAFKGPSHPPPNLMIAGGGAVDLWRVPREIGAQAMRRMEMLRFRIWPAVLRCTDEWIFGTNRLAGAPPSISAHGSQVARVRPDELVLVPPSRTPLGRVHWEWSQDFPWLPVPEPEPVLATFDHVATSLHAWEVSP